MISDGHSSTLHTSQAIPTEASQPDRHYQSLALPSAGEIGASGATWAWSYGFVSRMCFESTHNMPTRSALACIVLQYTRGPSL